MKTTLIILLFAAMFCQAGCSQGVQQQAKPQKTDWEKETLKGKVKSEIRKRYSIKDTILLSAYSISAGGNKKEGKSYKLSDTINVDGEKMRGVMVESNLTLFNADGFIEYENADGRISRYKYNANKQLIEKTYIEVDSSISIYKDGNVAEEQLYNPQTGEYYGKYIYKYDTHNNLIEKISQNNQNAQIIEKKYSYTYDSSDSCGRPKEVIKYNEDGSIDTKTLYTYNNDIQESIDYRNENGVFEKCFYIKFGKHGVEKAVYYDDMGTETKKYLYTYNDKGASLSEKRYNNNYLEYEFIGKYIFIMTKDI